MIGCFRSHQRIWQRMVKENVLAVVVFEDDVLLADNFKERLKTVLAELPADWDICLLGAMGLVHPVRQPIATQIFLLATGGGRPSPGKSRTVSPQLFVPMK